MANNIVTLKNSSGDAIYPVTLTSSIYDESNNTLDGLLLTINSDIDTSNKNITDLNTNLQIEVSNINQAIQSINSKVDKGTNTGSDNLFYALTPGNTQTSVPGSSSSTANSLVFRDVRGNAEVADPLSALHIANKQYVDAIRVLLDEDINLLTDRITVTSNDLLNIQVNLPTLVNQQMDAFLSKSGGVINGDLTVKGNFIQEGESYTTHAEDVYSTSDYIYLRDKAVNGLADGAYSGIEFIKYDNYNNGRLAIDKNGIVRVGDVGAEQPLATREETPIDGGVAVWDEDTLKFITVNTLAYKTELPTFIDISAG